ncbi:MAG: DNA-directed RNA polymerase subunit beta, partial [Candidatus Pacebacteria bacterium]|nr:DNA-directed RNA polymerase subunit beta [Candidatus Paceibacterota bacterium]
MATIILKAFGVESNTEIKKLFSDVDNGDTSFVDETLKKDYTANQEEALLEIYRKMKPGEPVAIDNATAYFTNLFNNFARYDLDKVGRFKMNQRLNQNLDIHSKEHRVLSKNDIISVIYELIRMNNDKNATGDNIDHLGNRRIRSTGELLQNKLYIALTRLRRIIQDRMTSLDPATLTPAQLINPRIITTAINQEFLNTSPLSQYMEQTNVLAELEHKRRLTGTGPG